MTRHTRCAVVLLAAFLCPAAFGKNLVKDLRLNSRWCSNSNTTVSVDPNDGFIRLEFRDLKTQYAQFTGGAREAYCEITVQLNLPSQVRYRVPTMRLSRQSDLGGKIVFKDQLLTRFRDEYTWHAFAPNFSKNSGYDASESEFRSAGPWSPCGHDRFKVRIELSLDPRGPASQDSHASGEITALESDPIEFEPCQ